LIEPHTSFETKLAMFGAAVVAQYAGETCVTQSRIIAALFRTVSVGEFFARAGIDAVRVLDVVEDPQTPSFEECERGAKRDLAEQGIEFASKEHQARIQLRPLDPVVRGVFDAVLERHGQLGVPPLNLLRDLIRSAPALAERLRLHGLDTESISAELEKL
jgi:hypothetical protein